MKQLVLKLDVNDDQVVKIALDRIARISGKYVITMDTSNKLCTVKGENVDPIQIVRKLRMLGHIGIVTAEPPKEPEKKSEELVEEVVDASSLATSAGPSKMPKKKEDKLKKEEPTKQEEKKKSERIITDVKARQMTKAVLKLDLHDDDKTKKKVMKTVSNFSGVDTISMDMKDKKLTVIGDIDPVNIVAKLRKLCHTEIVTVGPAKVTEKKKEELKKDESKKQRDQKKDQEQVAELVKAYQAYNPHMPKYYYPQFVEADPSASTLAFTGGPSKELEKKKEEQKKEESREQEDKKKDKKEDPDESLLATSGASKELEKKKKELKKEEKKEEHYEDLVNHFYLPQCNYTEIVEDDPVAELVKAYKAYDPHISEYYYPQSVEDDPAACVIS